MQAKNFRKSGCSKLTLLLICFAAASSNAQDSTKAAFKPSGKLWGYAFGDYAWKTHADSLKRGTLQYSGIEKDRSSFDFRRIYLGYDYAISEKFSASLLLSYEGNNDASGNRTVFIKAANLKWKNIYPGADLLIGQMETPTWSLIPEKIWAYRSVEKTIGDQYGIARSSDMGIALQGNFNNSGNFGYNFLIGNGTSSKPENDKFKKFYADVFAKFFEKKLIVHLYGDFERTLLLPGFHKEKICGKFFAAYHSEKFTAGTEVFVRSLKNNVIYSDTAFSNTDTAGALVTGFSAFARGTIMKDKLFFFARTDYLIPDMNYKPERIYSSDYSTYNEFFTTIGLDYQPNPSVHIMPNAWFNAFSDRRNNVSGKTETDFDLVPRITFYFVFRS